MKNVAVTNMTFTADIRADIKTLTRCQIESVDSLNQTVNDILNGIIAPEGAKPSVPDTSSAQHLCLLMCYTNAKQSMPNSKCYM